MATESDSLHDTSIENASDCEVDDYSDGEFGDYDGRESELRELIQRLHETIQSKNIEIQRLSSEIKTLKESEMLEDMKINENIQKWFHRVGIKYPHKSMETSKSTDNANIMNNADLNCNNEDVVDVDIDDGIEEVDVSEYLAHEAEKFGISTIDNGNHNHSSDEEHEDDNQSTNENYGLTAQELYFVILQDLMALRQDIAQL